MRRAALALLAAAGAVYYLGQAAGMVAAAPHRTPPVLWLVTERFPDGGIGRSWTTARWERDGCSVSLPDEDVVLVGDPLKMVSIERWR